MSFRDIKGQDEVISYLKKIIEKGHIPPTLLLYGPKGVGKRITALTFAKALNCKETSNDSCDKCKSCLAIKANTHPNVQVIDKKKIGVNGKAYSGDEGKGFGIDEVREVVEHSFVPIGGGYKINIFLDVDNLSIQAFNSMLKFFEEPPPDTSNILITSDVDNVPETIRSRAVELRFKPLSKEVIKEILIEKNIDKETAEIISYASRGSLDEAFSLLEEGALSKRKDLLKETLLFFKGETTIDKVFTCFKSYYDSINAQNVNSYFDEVLSILGDLIFVSLLKEPDKVLNIDIIGFLVDKFFGLEKRKIEQITRLLESGKMKLLANVNPMHIMMSVLFEIEEVFR